MTKAHLIAWMAENLLASTFIGTGALLALLLATWPLRALWRWRHKPKCNPCVGDVFYGKSDNHFFAATYYVVQNVGPMGVQVARDDDPMNIKAYSHRELWSLKKWHKVTKGKLFAEGVRDVEPPATERQNKPIPTVFADAKGYADSANAPDRVTEKQVRELINERHDALDKRRFERIYARLAALEAKEAPKRGFHADANGWARPVWMMRPNESMLRPDSPEAVKCDIAAALAYCAKATPAPMVPEVRVFRLDDQTHWLWTPDGGVWCYGKRGASVFCVGRLTIKDFDNDPNYSELVGPVYDAIVAEWRAWLGKQK